MPSPPSTSATSNSGRPAIVRFIMPSTSISEIVKRSNPAARKSADSLIVASTASTRVGLHTIKRLRIMQAPLQSLDLRHQYLSQVLRDGAIKSIQHFRPGPVEDLRRSTLFQGLRHMQNQPHL